MFLPSASTRGSRVVEQPGEFLRRKTEQEVLIPAAVPTRRKGKKDKRRHAPANKVWRVEGKEGRGREGEGVREEGGGREGEVEAQGGRRREGGRGATSRERGERGREGGRGGALRGEGGRGIQE